MCLGIPGKVTDTYHANDMPMGTVDFGGVAKRVCLAYTPDVAVGDYVVVHVGFALQRIDETEAREVFALLRQLDELGELGEGDEQNAVVEQGVGGEDNATESQPSRGDGLRGATRTQRGSVRGRDDLEAVRDRAAGGPS